MLIDIATVTNANDRNCLNVPRDFLIPFNLKIILIKKKNISRMNTYY